MPVLDASVCVALFKADEAMHGAAATWFRESLERGDFLVAPTLVLAEVGAALGRGLDGAHHARRAIEALLGKRLLELFPVTAALANRAGEIAADHRIRGCDAIYLALAEQLETSLITLDRDQLERGAAVVRTKPP
jgi:predicted nucleic acid-binding protein